MGPVVLLASLLLSTTAPSSPEPTPPGRMVRRSIAATMWPIEPAFAAGFVWSGSGMVPFVGANAFVPVIPGVGPVLAGRVSGASVGAAGFTEAQVGIGAAWEGRLGELRARVSLIPTAVITAVGGDAIVTTTATPGVLVPLELGLPLGGGVSFGAVVEPGVAVPVRIVVDNRIETGRDRLFVNVGASLTFGGPFD